MSRNKTTKKRWTFFLFQTLLSSFLEVLFIFAGAAFLVVLFFYCIDTPPAESLEKRRINQTSVFYDRSGEHILYKMFGEENRQIIPHSEIPDAVRIATIAAEDDAFYDHHGVDFASLLRAAKINFENKSMSQGGSTITQQLVRNALLTREKTILRKIREVALAIKIERKYSKSEILDFYLNEVAYGSNAYGVQAAAETFFGKKARNLSLDEAALLAALPKAPSFYSPYGSNSRKLENRQKKIIQRISDLRLVGEKEAGEALENDTLRKIVPRRDPLRAEHFVFYVRSRLEGIYGREFLEREGLKIYTTLDYALQQKAETIVREGAERNARYRASNAALVAIDPKNGEILAMVGSKGYYNDGIDGQVNVTIRPRQPGSAFKPFAYAKAFENGYQPETLINDVATNFGPDGSGRDYVPRNYDGKFHGTLSMRQALAMSLNIPAIKTLSLVGVDDTIELAKRLGITTLNEPKRYGLSLAIGGGEITLLDGTAAFSVFANDGLKNASRSIQKIIDGHGVAYMSQGEKNQRVLDPQVARKINSILSDNAARTPIFGPNNFLHISGKAVAAKTGTTQDFRDAWTIGYSPEIAVGVWAGNNDNMPMVPGADGSYVAAPIWNKFMRTALTDRPDSQFVAYDSAQGDVRIIVGEKDINEKEANGEDNKDKSRKKKDKKRKKG